MEKLRMMSPDLTDANIEKLAELFPAVVTEAVDAYGNVKMAVNFDLLRQELSDHVVEGPQERYRLDWPGKRAAAFAANAPIAKTLRPVRDESVDFDTTKNLFIEGDNLDALKLLQESYLGKVKLIYIDPPYNTGSDLLYDDDFGISNGEYLRRTGEVDDDGIRLVVNTETNGRFHSDWLSMVYPRIKLARPLLQDDGIIMVSINDAEAPRLRQVMDEVFGEANFLGQLVWMKGKEGGNDNAGFGQHHEYIVVYARDKSLAAGSIALDDKDVSRHRSELPEANRTMPGTGGIYREGELFQLINLSKQKDYTVNIPLQDGSVIEWPSYAPQKTIDEYLRVGKVFVGSKGVPYVKSFLADEAAGSKPGTLIGSEWGTTKAGGIAVRDLFGSSKMFSYPKPPQLIARLIQISGVKSGETVLDFFAGSAATAEAVFRLNVLSGTSIRFALIQVAEEVRAGTDAANAGFEDIAELSRERVRRAGAKFLEGSGISADSLDTGFRALRVDTTNMTDVLRTPDEADQLALDQLEDSVKPDRSGEDLLFQVLIDWGLEITMPIKVEKVEQHEVFVVEDGALIACFEEHISPAVVRTIAARQPLRVVFRDSGFASDDARINAEQVFREAAPATEVKTI